MPGSGGVAHRTPVDLRTTGAIAQQLVAPTLAGALLLAWLVVDPRTPDLAAATYRVTLFHQSGFAIWDEHWYAGHDLPGYSLLFAPLAALLGLRLLAVACVLASAALFARIASDVYGSRARWGAAAFAVAAVGDAWIGRLAFALGVSLALGAVLAQLRRRRLVAVSMAALCAAASPVAGVLLALAGATHAVHRRSAEGALVLAVPALAVAGVMTALFGDGGSEPFPFLSLLATLGVLAAFALALPREQRLLRTGAAVYLLACLASLALHTAMGSNIERYGVLLAGPLLLCALASTRRARPVAAIVLALAAWGVWVAWGPLRETLAVAGDRSTSAAYYAPVEQFFALRAPARVEVPLTRSHWEAALLAPSVSLARGWEKQLDERYDAALLSPHLSPAAYERWLREQAVGYVALPDARLDGSSAAEGRLIRAGLPYLHPLYADAHWRIYEVLGAQPLLSGPGRLMSLGHDSFTLTAQARAELLVRVRYSRYLTVIHGRGCVARAPGGWTYVLARKREEMTVAARFSLARALGLTPSCRP